MPSSDKVAFAKACGEILDAVDAANLDLPSSVKITIEDGSAEPETSGLMKSVLAREISRRSFLSPRQRTKNMRSGLF